MKVEENYPVEVMAVMVLPLVVTSVPMVLPLPSFTVKPASKHCQYSILVQIPRFEQGPIGCGSCPSLQGGLHRKKAF
jgi:hypothetical protein